ncbi:uncharacterized protein LOC115625108 isoform X2 [Scaptodrosophila lebanonensis]|uniref:Uncharacterized protein LOC115625108 isoform X2 n=1 Tax=Drosophila lebanonensis TaxID=7225 RepID=A0A6J2TIN0_DROLE|nr:uncharacterized protein LOC115625108 isoform X2 [Scaptodrosophila lebanonensis]
MAEASLPLTLQPPPKPKRTRAAVARQKSNALHYDSLPTAPPVLCSRGDDNIFQFPVVPTTARNKSVSPNSTRREELELPSCAVFCAAHGKHSCFHCQPYRADRATIEPLKSRLSSAIDAMDELSRTYVLLEGFLEKKLATITDEDESQEEQQPETSRNWRRESAASTKVTTEPSNCDGEFELERSLTLLESLLGTEVVPAQPVKQGKFKRIRERSKSMMEDEINLYLSKDRTLKNLSSRPYLLRRQSTYSDNKSKVSKWTKVKAAFKWERANVPPPNPNDPDVLLPVNNEVERYLKVPMKPAAGGSSSADSIISSSSGFLVSDTGGTPGTISSSSSVDDLDARCRHTTRRDSSKSDTRCDSHTSNFESGVVELRKSATDERLDVAKSVIGLPTKSSSNKSLRRSKAFSDFEVLPEDHVAEIKARASRRTKSPPSPLNLNQISSDLPQLHSPLLKSPKDGISQMRRIHSPGNSSVPSSPSRHSDFFGEFESEDLSSGDFSEPTTPNHMEFKHKQREFDRFNTINRSGTLRGAKKSSEEHSPTQVLHNELMSTAELEQNLTPEFKKKLHKWRAKQQASGNYSASEPAVSPTTKSQGGETKSKIDWNLWSTGQLKLEGQGLSALPEQKNLPEKFQKKLEQWNKLKSTSGAVGGGANSDNDTLKRGSKHSQSTRRGSDDDRWYKHKPHDKEKLARLKAIVAPDHTTKNIEVKTSDGEVMKFEGISRKFTRKLYEWEKARGIGPEASTFALLHPGYCPIDVGRINKENNNVQPEHSPTLSRSLSLDSMAPGIGVPAISQQASSLSLNDVNELKDIEGSAYTEHEFKKFDEPEAVMVEVEEHIHDTASPLVTAHTLVEQQTPIYKYEEVQCNDYCNSRRVQSFESHTNLAPLLGVLKRADELFTYFKQLPEILEHSALRDCQAAFLSIRTIYPYYSNNLMKANVLNAISDVQSELGRLSDLRHKSPLDEACCQETMKERTQEYIDELIGLHESLECLKLAIQGGTNRYLRDIVPDINITTEDGLESPAYATCDNSSRDQLSTPIDARDEQSGTSHVENETETSTTVYRGDSIAGANTTCNGTKKKLRLRKLGSRQNSKTESDSSDADTHSVLETPRRIRRKNFRLKQRSLDDDFRLRSDDIALDPRELSSPQVDVLYTSLKVKPGEPIKESQTFGSSVPQMNSIEPVIKSTGLAFVPPPLPDIHPLNYNTNANVFVKTKRKMFTTIVEPQAAEGIAVVEKELEDFPGDSTLSVKENFPLSVLSRGEQSRPVHLYRSISLEHLTSAPAINEEQRRCQSSENLTKRPLVRPPLATDSIRTINKTLVRQEQLSKLSFNSPQTPLPRKEHMYKKHSLHKSHSASVSNKIEHKIAKTSSGSAVAVPDDFVAILDISTALTRTLPNKLDNTLPRIHRKLEGKALTPTTPKHFEFPPAIDTNSVVLPANDRPVTPLSERALRLQRARAQFLQSVPVTARQGQNTSAELPTVMRGATLLTKSISAGTISTEEQREVAVDQDQVSTGTSTYDSLPRSVSRSGKISSKLGFATLASKLRRVKGGGSGKKSKDSPTGSALSTLCRQTLPLLADADIIGLPNILGGSSSSPAEPKDISNTSHYVHKSQSSPQATASNMNSSRERLNKSLSEQYVRQLKESDV